MTDESQCPFVEEDVGPLHGFWLFQCVIYFDFGYSEIVVLDPVLNLEQGSVVATTKFSLVQNHPYQMVLGARGLVGFYGEVVGSQLLLSE